MAASNRASWGARAGFAKLEQAERLLVAGRGAKGTECACSGQGEASADVAAVLEAFKQELREDMLSIIEKALSAKAAAPPAADAATGDGEASAQDLKVQLQQLQQTVAELRASYEKMQQQYFQAWADKGAAEAKNMKLEAMVQDQAARIKRMESPFNTPLKSAFAASHQGGVQVPRQAGL